MQIPPKPILVIGAGGHARVVVATLQAGGFDVSGLFDDDANKLGKKVLGLPVLGKLADLVRYEAPSLIIAVGNNCVRKDIAHRFSGSKWVTAVHPQAFVHGSVKLGPGTVVFAGAVIQPGARLGAHCIVNTGATIDHDCRLGDFVHVAPGSHLAGEVVVGDGVLLGIGSVVIPDVEIGGWTTVGAGAAVLSDLPASCTAVGVPARVNSRGERTPAAD